MKKLLLGMFSLFIIGCGPYVEIDQKVKKYSELKSTYKITTIVKYYPSQLTSRLDATYEMYETDRVYKYQVDSVKKERLQEAKNIKNILRERLCNYK